VLWSNGNGAWIGRCNGKMGWFQASSVVLVSPSVGLGGRSSANGESGVAAMSVSNGQFEHNGARNQRPNQLNSVRPRPSRPNWSGTQQVS
jgi:hypothetical protein